MAMILAHDLHLPAWLGHPVEFSAPHRPGNVTRSRLGRWVLVAKRDPFSGAITCTLRGERMSVAHSALTFEFSSRADTYDAAYRLDAGPAIPWRASAMTLAASGVRFDTGDAANPSGGLVSLPLGVVAGARTVWVRPSPKAHAVAFKIEDLGPALAAAKSAGCGAAFEPAAAE